jgi:hypothetical protein
MADGVWQDAVRQLSMGAVIEALLGEALGGGKSCR